MTKQIVTLIAVSAAIALGVWLSNRTSMEDPSSPGAVSGSLPEAVDSRTTRDSAPVNTSSPYEPAARAAPDSAGPPAPRNGTRLADSEAGEGRIQAIDELRQLRRESQKADRLEAESPLLDGRSLSAPAIQALQTASPEDFDAVLDRLEEESMSDPLALELTDAYERFMNQRLDGAHGDFRMDRLACGLRTCVGESFVDPGLWDAALTRWQDGYGPPRYAISDWPIRDQGGNIVGHRIIFSTDPENDSISVPISYRPPDPSDPPPASDRDG